MDQPGPGFYSQLFLAEKVTRGWRPVIDPSSLGGFVTLMKFKMETVKSVLGSLRKGDWIFLLDLKDDTSRSLAIWNLCISLVMSRGMCLPVPCHVFRSLHGPASVHKSLHPGFGVGTLEGHVPSQLPGRFAGHCRV